MKRREYDIEKLARARHFFEKEGVHEDVFTYHNLRCFGKMRNLVDEDIQFSPAYIEETRIMVEDMLSRFTTLTLTYEDDSTFQEVEDIVQGWVHFDTLEIDEVERRIILEGEKEVLERVKIDLEEIVRGMER